jgi:YbbR domain-containing protein
VRLFANLRYRLLAVAIAIFLWVVARGSSNVERGYDIPVALNGLPEEVVVVDQGADMVNVRVSGTRVALRKFEPEKLEYTLDVSGAKPGRADYEVDLSSFDLPRGARIVSRSPARIELAFERRAAKPVRVRADLEGRPAPGFRVRGVEVDPPRVRIAGARSEVLRLSEVVTETIDVAGATAPIEKEVRVLTGAGHVWADQPRSVKVRVAIEAEAPLEGPLAPEARAPGTPGAPPAPGRTG